MLVVSGFAVYQLRVRNTYICVTRIRNTHFGSSHGFLGEFKRPSSTHIQISISNISPDI